MRTSGSEPVRWTFSGGRQGLRVCRLPFTPGSELGTVLNQEQDRKDEKRGRETKTERHSGRNRDFETNGAVRGSVGLVTGPVLSHPNTKTSSSVSVVAVTWTR